MCRAQLIQYPLGIFALQIHQNTFLLFQNSMLEGKKRQKKKNDNSVARLHVYLQKKGFWIRDPYTCSAWLSDIQSLKKVSLSVPICCVMSFCRVIGSVSYYARRFPSKMPVDKGLDTKSLRTMLKVSSVELSITLTRGEMYRNALGFNSAVYWMFGVSWPWSSYSHTLLLA